MLFNSYIFIAVFLPAAVAAVWLAKCYLSHNAALAALTLASLFFYAWWNPPYVILLLASIAANYLIGRQVRHFKGVGRRSAARILTILGVGANLGIIGYYKYADFFVTNIDGLTGLDFTIGVVLLPLGISFFTFQQIAYLVDSYREQVQPHNFLDYAMFISFFPQLIAGPIVYHGEMLRQLHGEFALRFTSNDVAIGLTIFTMGLFKKVVLADGMATYATPGFDAVEAGAVLNFLEAWSAALAYTLQLYFDFSGYSDMAIGLGRIFGLRLPVNFNSPYKADNIIEFWRRWHMTLSRFLRLYLYVPLGGNRRGPYRRWLNIMITMLLGGLWHGAGWTFVVWGGLHGCYLAVNHLWRYLRTTVMGGVPITSPERFAGFALTFVAVVVAWIFFRAESFTGALAMLEGMAGLNGIILPEVWAVRLTPLLPILNNLGIQAGPTPLFDGSLQLASTVALLLFVFLSPNSQEWVERQFEVDGRRPQGVSGALTATLFGCMAGYTAIRIFVGGYSEFLYFQF